MIDKEHLLAFLESVTNTQKTHAETLQLLGTSISTTQGAVHNLTSMSVTNIETLSRRIATLEDTVQSVSNFVWRIFFLNIVLLGYLVWGNLHRV